MMYHLRLSHPCMSHLCTIHLHTSHPCTSHLCTIVHNKAGSYTVLEVSLSIPEPDPLPTCSTVLRGMPLTFILMRMILSFVMMMGMDKVRLIIPCAIQSNLTLYRYFRYRPFLSCSQYHIAVQMVSISRQSSTYIYMTKWMPVHQNMQTFLTDNLFNLPWLRFSQAQQKAMLTWARELGASVPNYNQYCRVHASICERVRKPPQRQATGDRNIWYLNEIGDAIAKVMNSCCQASNH